MAADVAERDATSGGMRLSRGLSLGASRDQDSAPHTRRAAGVGGSAQHHPSGKSCGKFGVANASSREYRPTP